MLEQRAQVWQAKRLSSAFSNTTVPITINLGEDRITSTKSIDVLGVLFDMKLTWSSHVWNAIAKATKSCNAIRLMRRFFNTKELLIIPFYITIVKFGYFVL
jgi:hypothetical protein